MDINKIVLINPYPYYASGINEANVTPPLGITYIAAYLREKIPNINIKIIDACLLEKSNSKIIEELKIFNPDIVGIYVNIISVKAATELSQLIKKNLNKLVVLGGPYATSQTERVLFNSKADAVVRGEGEITFYEIVKKGNFKDIDGVSYIKNNKIVHNKNRELIEDLDKLPFPALDLLPSLKQYKARARRIPMGFILTSRGCPYQCTYCNRNIFGNKFRVRSPENIINEIEYLIKNFGIKELLIWDDNFTLDNSRAEKILDLIIEKKFNLTINLQNGVRADRLTRELVTKMKKAGVYKTGIGIESGNKEILKSIKKSLDLEKVKKAIKWFREEGIITIGFFMLGFPEDTKETMQDTINFAIETNPSIGNFSIIIPFPGTELYDLVKSNKWFIHSIEDGSETGFLSKNFYFETNKLKKEDVFKYQKMAYKKFNFRLSKIFEMLMDIRSYNEFKWTFFTGLNIIKEIIIK